MRAKLTLGLKVSLKYEDISMEEVQSKFVAKTMQVIYSSLPMRNQLFIPRVAAKWMQGQTIQNTKIGPGIYMIFMDPHILR